MAADSYTQDGVTVSSNFESPEELRAAFDVPSEDEGAEPAEQTEPVEPAEPESTEAEKPAKRSLEGRKQSIQTQIDELVRQRGDTQRERDEIRTELETLRTEKARLTAKPAAEPKPADPKADGADPEPKEEDFETYREYVKAQSRWEVRQELTTRESAAQARIESERHRLATEQRGAQFATRLAAAREAHPDFDARIDVNLVLTAPMADVVQDSEVGPDLLAYLSEHQEDAQRIRSMGRSWAAFGEMKKLEARVEAAHSGPAPAPVKLSQAKPPIKPVGDSSSAAGSGPPGDDASYEEHEAYYNREERQAKRRG